MPNVILYIAMTLDGFIAEKDGGIGFLDKYQDPKDDHGYAQFFSTISTIIMGYTTYKQVGHLKEFKDYYKDTPIIVLTRNPAPAVDNVSFTSQSVSELLQTLSGNVWLMGGAYTCKAFFKQDLVDEMILAILPETLGEGVRLFDQDVGTKQFTLTKTTSHSLGIVMLYYKRMVPQSSN